MKIKNLLPAIALLGLSLSGCYSDKEDILYPQETPTCANTDSKFSTSVNSIIQSKCASSGCHDATTQASGYKFVTYTDIHDNIESVNNSVFVSKTMPKSGSAPLTEKEKVALKCWIDAGALNN